MTLKQQQLTDTANALIEAADKIFMAAYGEQNINIIEAAVAINDHDDDSSAEDIEYHASNAIACIEDAKEADLRDGYLNEAYQATLTAATNAIEELRETDYNETDNN
jgi:hypothetical protein